MALRPTRLWGSENVCLRGGLGSMHLTTKGAAIVATISLAVAAAGVTLAPTIASATRAGAPDSITNCTDGGPCITGNNSGTGPGVKGASAAGLGVLGQTTFNSTGK